MVSTPGSICDDLKPTWLTVQAPLRALGHCESKEADGKNPVYRLRSSPLGDKGGTR